MFCYHCQEAKKNVVCDSAGICGKKEDVASLQDLLVYVLKGLSFYAHHAGQLGIRDARNDRFTARALYSTVTNVNFDPAVFVSLIQETVQRRNHLRHQFNAAFEEKSGAPFSEPVPEEASWHYTDVSEAAFVAQGEAVGVTQIPALDTDCHALRELLVYGLKGLASLIEHAEVLDFSDAELYAFMHEALAFSLKADSSFDELMAMNLKCGELGMAAFALLDKANTARFGDPVPTKVYFDSWDKPGILVSGHDLRDIEDLLEQTAGTGVDVYTHGEAIAAHAYPALKKYFNLAGNFGDAWQEQRTDFQKFNGPILITTNSIQQQKDKYKDKIYTTGMVGWPDIPHIADRKPGQRKDFSALIEQARQCEPPSQLSDNTTTLGYAHQSLHSYLDSIAAGIKDGSIRRLVVLAGADGRHKERRYYAQIAELLPQDTLILTAGDTKYRFNTLAFGNINGIPRLLDAGQSNDFYSLVVFLKDLQQALGLADLNALPVSFNIAWYEQKTILMTLGLLALNVKNVRLGPTLPPFFSAKIKDWLTEQFALKGIDKAENDVAAMLEGN
ncbi:hydroxylamine reductase [Methylobacter sp.]|uniref:hydroxylamine reductase n=1 Tax=Methylobacter sp. TaxID=2051955 RepID=UPI003DA4E2DC